MQSTGTGSGSLGIVAICGHAPVNNALFVQVPEAERDLGCVEYGPLLFEAAHAHVVDVELEVAAIHDGQHQTQRLLRLERVRQTHLQDGWSVRTCK